MRIAVTGGTGRIGGRVVRLLQETGQHDVVALSSRTAPYDDAAALRTAFAGVDTLVVVSSDGEAARVVVHHRNVVRAASDSGVGHAVFLSGLDVAADSPFCYAFTNQDAEQRLRESGLAFSIVRAGLYTEFVLDLIRRCASAVPRGDVPGAVGLPAGDARVSLVAREDVAQALAALALGGPTHRHHVVTGPESLRVDEVAAAAGFRFTEVAPAQLAATLAGLGEQTWWIHAYASMFAAIRQDRWAAVGHGLTQLTGRRPLPLSAVLAAQRPVPLLSGSVPTTHPHSTSIGPPS